MKKRALKHNGNVCKDCRYFTNNPGTCNFNNQFIARKHSACQNYKRKSKK